MIDVGYSDYEIDQIIQRIRGRSVHDNLDYEDLTKEYDDYVVDSKVNDSEYYPFYFWALKNKFNMYLWKPNLFQSKEEEHEVLDKYYNLKKSLSFDESKLIKKQYREYRDKHHKNGEFMYPAFYWHCK